MKCAVYRVDTGLPFIADATLVTNGDGSVSFQLPNGGYAGQEPNAYGVRHDQDPNTGAPQPYQKATVNGSCVTFVTRPQDAPMGYLLASGTAY
jgi:hypothetical protein